LNIAIKFSSILDSLADLIGSIKTLRETREIANRVAYRFSSQNSVPKYAVLNVHCYILALKICNTVDEPLPE
jgi:hypothetical protein